MNRSLLLDLLRIFAIALVFVAHIGQALGHESGNFFGIKNFYFVSLGGVGVSLFLILSGLLAGLTEAGRKSRYGEYLLKKILRIYPLYWLAVISSFLLFQLAEDQLLKPGNWFPSGPGTDLLGSLTGFYSWLGLWGGPYNPPSWFIALIMVLYALFPLLAWTITRRPHLSLLVLLAISIGSRLYLGRYGLPFGESHFWDGAVEYTYRQFGFMPGRPTDWFPLCRVFEFGLGSYLALNVNRDWWFALRLGQTRLVNFFSDLSFPLFLVHYPLLFTLEEFQGWGMTTPLAISIYLALSVALAYPLSRLDQQVPRQKIVGMFRTGKRPKPINP